MQRKEKGQQEGSPSFPGKVFVGDNQSRNPWGTRKATERIGSACKIVWGKKLGMHALAATKRMQKP